MLPLFVVIPLGVAFLIPVISKVSRGSARLLALGGGLALAVFSLLSLSWLQSGPVVYALGGWKPPFGICMVLDGLGALLLVVINLIAVAALVYSTDYLKRYSYEELYYTLFSLMLAGLNGMAISGDLFNIFVFLEITSVACYALVAFGTEAEELEAALKYLVLGSVADVLILFAIGLLYGRFSTLNLADLAVSVTGSDAGALKNFAMVLFITGFGLKTALVPFHAWLPDAHPAAPAPVSAMLSGVVIKTAGVYVLARIAWNVFGAQPAVNAVFIWLGIVSMVAGVLLAIGQWDFKRLLAYHSISQVGYIMYGLGLGSALGLIGGLFHLLNHAFFKSLLFLNAGSVEYATGTRRLDKVGGLEKRMPVTAVTSLIASLSIAGIPPLCGFWSKLIIILAAIQKGHWVGVFSCIGVSVVTLASFLKVQHYAFLRPAPDPSPVQEVPMGMRLGMALLALACIALGLWFAPVVRQVVQPAAETLLQGAGYSAAVLGGGGR